MNSRYIRQDPYVDEDGMYEPIETYVPEGCESVYRCIMTKEMFVEAYNKWIKHSSYGFIGQDDADDWSED